MEAVNDSKISVDITSLRKQRRPLWMTHLGITSYAEFLGSGGDIYSDRLEPEWQRFTGEEMTDTEEEAVRQVAGATPEWQGEGFPPQGELAETVEKAFKYVHFSSEESS